MQAQLKTAQADTRPKFLIELAKPTQTKNVLKNFQRFKKNKTPDTQTRQKSTRQMTETNYIKMVATHARLKRQPITAPTRNWRFSGSFDSFVVQQTFVLRMNICGENRQLLVAANR